MLYSTISDATYRWRGDIELIPAETFLGHKLKQQSAINMTEGICVDIDANTLSAVNDYIISGDINILDDNVVSALDFLLGLSLDMNESPYYDNLSLVKHRLMFSPLEDAYINVPIPVSSLPQPLLDRGITPINHTALLCSDIYCQKLIDRHKRTGEPYFMEFTMDIAITQCALSNYMETMVGANNIICKIYNNTMEKLKGIFDSIKEYIEDRLNIDLDGAKPIYAGSPMLIKEGLITIIIRYTYEDIINADSDIIRMFKLYKVLQPIHSMNIYNKYTDGMLCLCGSHINTLDSIGYTFTRHDNLTIHAINVKDVYTNLLYQDLYYVTFNDQDINQYNADQDINQYNADLDYYQYSSYINSLLSLVSIMPIIKHDDKHLNLVMQFSKIMDHIVFG